jgi:hypothetical protein
MTFRRRALALLVAGALTFGLAGCFGQPAAKPSTPAPAFTSDAAAYAAAEKVYREYVDALNQVDLADPKTFEPVFALTTGEANAGERKRLSGYHAEGATVEGQTRVALVEPVGVSSHRRKVELAACEDVSEVALRDASGASLVSPDRPDMQPITVNLRVIGTEPVRLLVESVEGREGPPSC